MEPAQIVVTLVGITLMAGVAWFFWGSRRAGVRASVTSAGVQELLVLVKGGYNPSVIEVQAGTPVRLTFQREESAACTEVVVFPDFDRSARLPEGERIPVDFVPEVPGSYAFSCEMGMVRGMLLVR
ncbi:MAG: cupredoxin domain-containing protein [Solirubrobacterales bacterium]|nr:cupredoxin domain-containing protein [Solirubrobacterales bacterium]